MTSKIVLITGANRGLGQGLVKLFLAQPKYVCTLTLHSFSTFLGMNETPLLDDRLT